MSRRAQSESIGVILLTAVVVVTVSAGGAIVLADASGDPETRADLSVSIADEGVSVAHNGGEAVPFDDLRVVVRHGNETWRPAVNASGVVRGGADARLDSGDRWIWRQSLDDSVVTTVQVFDRRTNTLLAEARRYPTAESSLTPTTGSSTPTVTGGADAATATATPTPTATPDPSPDSPTFAGTAVHDLSASEDRLRVDYNVTNRSQFSEVRVRFENKNSGEIVTRTNTNPRGGVEYTLGYDGNVEYDITIQLVDDSGIVVEERTVTDTADGVNPSGNDDLARPDSPDLTKRAVIDGTDTNQDSVQFDAQYRTANWTNGSRVEVIFENLDAPGASKLNSSTQANGSVRYTQSYGANDGYAIRYVLYDADGVLVDSTVVNDTADGENPATNDDMSGSGSPTFAGTVVSDLSTEQADYELFYNVTNRSSFARVEVEIENLDSGGADATYTSTDPRDAITTYREQSYGGTLGDEYRITLTLVDENGIITDERVVTDIADFEDPAGNADLSQGGSPTVQTFNVEDRSKSNQDEVAYRIDYEVTPAATFGEAEIVFANKDSPYQSGTLSSTAAKENNFDYTASGYGDSYVIRFRVYDSEGVLVAERRVPASGTDRADGNDP